MKLLLDLCIYFVCFEESRSTQKPDYVLYLYLSVIEF